MAKDILPENELVFGLVGAVGTDLQYIQNVIRDNLTKFNYHVENVRLSSLLEKVEIPEVDGKPIKLIHEPEDKRISSYMDAGNALRKKACRGDILALLVINEIQKKRQSMSQPSKLAYILQSLKHPDEVHTLRRIYGAGFFLVGVYCPYQQCQDQLAAKIAKSHGSADGKKYKNIAGTLLKRDQKEEDKYGQRVRDTFHLADVFVSIQDEKKSKSKINRFMELLFGNTFHTPTRDEYFMYFAHAAATRSASLGRQVGAAVSNKQGELIAIGTNDVPCFGGGLYWPDSAHDARDHKLKPGEDSNHKHINDILKELLEKLQEEGMIKGEVNLTDFKTKYKNTRLMNLTEFGRMVHAEMEAIAQCVRTGISIRGCVLYTTLFPCHNCAKHIVDAGIEKVIYIEPYAKSLAGELHKDSISIDQPSSRGEKVSFLPFEGIGPRRYMDLFSLITSTGDELKRKDDRTGKVKKWRANADMKPRLILSPITYLDSEKDALSKLDVRGD